jgi:cell wall-associated NlpC family hydrolase
MRRNRLASAAVAAVAISVPVTAVAGTAFAGTAQAATTKAAVTWNMVAAAKAKQLVGYPYVYGGTSTSGFDCSGLTQWVYRHTGHGKAIDRIANDQFHEFKRISHAAARPGDLVFFHDSSDLSSYVYHVGVYEGGNYMVAATTPGGGVQSQSFSWAGSTVSFGTITH